MTLPEFLLARIVEDEAALREASERDSFDQKRSFYTGFGVHRDDWGLHTFNVPPARLAAECEAKRRIVEQVRDPAWSSYAVRDFVLGNLALPYADHPDYRQEWAP